jgi:hypothetical protein
VHEHIDRATADTRHLRCNLFLQLPDEGGLPIIEGQLFVVSERSVLAFFSNEKMHASQSVGSSKWRIILSFGYLVPKTYHLPSIQHL